MLQKSLLPYLYILLAAVLSISASGCSQETEARKAPPTVVQVLRLSEAPYLEKEEYLATMRSRKSVSICPFVEGHVTEILVQAGTEVKAGSLLMTIDSRVKSAQTQAVDAAAHSVESDLEVARATLASLESTLESKKAEAEYTRSQFERYKNLKKDGAVSDADLDSWKNRSVSARAEVDAALQQIKAQKMTIQKHERNHEQALANLQAEQANLKYYRIEAPFAGTVGDIPVKLGDYVTTSTTLTSVTENHPLEAYMSIPAEKAASISKGSSVELVSSEGDQFGQAKVAFIAPTVDPDSQTVLVKALYPNTNSRLRADQVVNALIRKDSKRIVSVPTTAVSQTAGKYFVFKAEEKSEGKLVASRKEVEVYGIEGTAYRIKSGLKDGDRVIVSGIQRLADGVPVTAAAK
ncbi:MAG: efflux RND transporter periplasmic adaptor subunit [Candidatus Obscuribacterales bacterium]|nr:efflux RND transporter periplasmic adaptor subunit [Candidatus Obscuribacterales bacterium]